MTTEELDRLYGEALALRAKLNAAIEDTYSEPGVSAVRAKLYDARSYLNQVASSLYELLPKLPRAGEDN